MAIVFGVFGLFVAFPGLSSAEEANLTRFGPEDYERRRGKPTTSSFTASDGRGKLLVRNRGVRSARVTVNGRTVVRSRDLCKRISFRDFLRCLRRTSGRFELLRYLRRSATQEKLVVRLKLNDQNKIKVKVGGKPGGKLRVCVTQRVDVDFNLVGQTHFGLNTSDFDRQLSFYHDRLGFEGLINPAGPETNTMSPTASRSL